MSVIAPQDVSRSRCLSRAFDGYNPRRREES